MLCFSVGGQVKTQHLMLPSKCRSVTSADLSSAIKSSCLGNSKYTDKGGECILFNLLLFRSVTVSLLVGSYCRVGSQMCQNMADPDHTYTVV